MFLGEYLHNLDAKGRLIIPSKFREELGPSCVITKGLDGCLFIFPQDEWRKLSEKLSQLPLTRQDARSFTRFFFSSASELDCDKQGRIAIPAHLLDYAHIEKSVQVIGMNGRIEIWDVGHWTTYQDSSDSSFEQLAELMDDFNVGL